VGLIQQRAGHRHLGVCEHGISARLFVLEPAPYALAVGYPSRHSDVTGKVPEPLPQGKHPQALAQALSRRQNSLGAFERRRRARLGPTSAIVATAHKLARLVSPLLTQRTPFRDRSAAASERRTRGRAIAALRKKAARFGFTLVEAPA
jgi:hypothetical protein